MKDIFFCQLEPGDTIWVVYDKNWDKDVTYSEYVLIPGKIIENKGVNRKIDVSDFYEDSKYVTRFEYWIEVSVEGLSNTYRRHYSDTYNEKGQMSLTPEYNDHGPNIEIFVTKDKAKDYLINWCEYLIGGLKEAIQKKQKSLEIYEKTIENIKNI